MDNPLYDFFDVLCGQDETLFYAVQFSYSGNSEKALRELNWARQEGYVEFYRIKNGEKELLAGHEVADLSRHSAVLPLSAETLREIRIAITDKGARMHY